MIRMLPILVLLSMVSVGLADEVDSLYYAMKFKEVVKELEEKSVDSLALNERLMLFESLARSGRSYFAKSEIDHLMRTSGRNDSICTAAAIIYQSMGIFRQAEEFLRWARNRNFDNVKMHLASAMYSLYTRQFDSAEVRFERAVALRPDLASTDLFSWAAMEIYRAGFDTESSSKEFARQAERFEAEGRAPEAGNCRKTSEMYSSLKGRKLFSIDTDSDKVVLPLFDFKPGSALKCLKLRVDNKDYTLLIDTGNGAAWTIHNSELRRKLISRAGGFLSVRTGQNDRSSSSQYIETDSICFEGVTIRNLVGLYFRKPVDPFFDATFNPYWIRDRVVTIDYFHNELIFRTKERFESDVAKIPRMSISRLPCSGYDRPFVPVMVNSRWGGMALIETGAQDISLRREYAESIDLPFSDRTVMDKEGKKHIVGSANVQIQVGEFTFSRPAAPVYPIKFIDKLTGMYDNVMIGPLALEGKFILSLDPFDKTLVLQNRY